MTQEGVEDYEFIIICRFCEKKVVSDKIRYYCHLTGKNRGPAHNTCNINVTQKQSNFITFVFHNCSNYDCHLFLKKVVDKKNGKVKFKFIPKTNEEYISTKYGCIKFVNS